MIATSARLNVLGNVTPTLTAAGLSRVRPGTIGMTPSGYEEALAARLGCRPDDVRAAATPYIGPERNGIVRWGSGALVRAHLETRRRRVAPSALASAPHHRAAWMNLMLDYCPETLERLIDACPRCLRPLGWRSAWGIGHCDDPDCEVLPVGSEFLTTELASGYRMFAELGSPVPEERSRRLAAMAPEFAALHPVAILDFAFRLGTALDAGGRVGRGGVCDMPGDARARSVATGAELLQAWPGALREAVRSAIAADDGRTAAARRSLKASLLRAATPRSGGDAVEAMLRDAIPEVFVEVGRVFSGIDRAMILGSESARRLCVTHAELAAASQNGVFTEEAVHEGGYRRVQYVEAEIVAAAAARRDSVPIGVVVKSIGAPLYACERIIGSGAIERERHPFALTLHGQPRAVKASLEDYVTSVERACRATPPPADAVGLQPAMRSIGGGLKPWRRVLAAVIAGALPCWLSPAEGSLADRMLVRQSDVARFSAVENGDGVSDDAHLSTAMSQLDAMAVLNLKQTEGPRLLDAGLITAAAGRRSLLIPIAQVVSLAREWISTAEIAANTALSPARAYRMVEAVLGPKPSPAGWLRTDYDRAFSSVT
ncbi:hypothetical protein [Sphingomonas sp. CFBP 13706]|uniref:hypothetical protein n=1 Tax=Sphingomonas sp. CFBP 13706 TaxID=2775314 RepID=UPI001783B714|nr:hypothetical protein [Sphingomonas sp. CFBP 13706]MBD8736231.1 hypothetical protein [Sphingomonas sp. CFBP 13706]